MSLADLIAYRRPGRAGGDLSQLSQLSQGLPAQGPHLTPTQAPPEGLAVATVASPIPPAPSPPQAGPFFKKESKGILSLSCARERESERLPLATLATLATPQGGEAGSPPRLALVAEVSDTRAAAHRRLWLVIQADGRLVSHSYTPPATEAEVRSWYPEALVIEPAEDIPEGELLPDREAWPEDDRITCRACRHRAGPRCQAARRGEFAQAAPWHEPDMEQPRRCYLFAPLPDDPNPVPGAERWPDLIWQRRASS